MSVRVCVRVCAVHFRSPLVQCAPLLLDRVDILPCGLCLRIVFCIAHEFAFTLHRATGNRFHRFHFIVLVFVRAYMHAFAFN